MLSIYSVESAKMKTTNARLLRHLMASDKNKKNLGPKVYLLKLYRKIQLPNSKKVVWASKGYHKKNIFLGCLVLCLFHLPVSSLMLSPSRITWYSWFSLKEIESARNLHSLHPRQETQRLGRSVPSASADRKSRGRNIPPSLAAVVTARVVTSSGFSTLGLAGLCFLR